MDVLAAIRERFSVRAFLDKPVARSVVEDILEVAKRAPSGVNSQPWQVMVVEGTVKDRIGERIIAARDAGVPENPDYRYYPKEWFEPYKSRRQACGLALYSALHIQKQETEKRKVAWYRNYHFFGAPVGLLFFVHEKLDTGSWMDVAMFMQCVMLAAAGHDLGTCPQASLAEYPDIVREEVKVAAQFKLVAGIALGYPDWDAPINQYRTTREPLSQFVTWVT